MSRRGITLGFALLAFVAFFSLLGWGLSRSGGAPGGPGVNEVFGEVDIEEKATPDFTLEILDGGSITLSDLRGKVVVVDFWASWCPPCRQEAPVLEQVYDEYRDKGVEFIGVGIWDQLNAARDFVEQFSVAYPTGLDTQGTILVEYGVRGIPEKFFIDPQGQVVAKFVGPSSVEGLRETLDKMLAGQE